MRFLLWLIVFVGLVYGGYIAYDKWFDGDPVLARKTPGDIFAFLKDQVVREASVLGDSRVEMPIREALSDKKQGIIDSAKEVAAQTAQRVGESFSALSHSLQVGTSSSSSLPHNAPELKTAPARVVLRVNEKFRLRLSSGAEKTTFIIGWDDGLRDALTLIENTSTEIVHAFREIGDYDVLLSSETGRGVVTHLIGLSVLSQ